MKYARATVERLFDFRSVDGPAFKDGVANDADWQAFVSLIVDEKALALANLWREKAVACGGIPMRKDFSFEEFVRFGSQIYMCKRTEEDRWMTTFCGEAIVDNFGYDPTGEHLDEVDEEDTTEFWYGVLTKMVENHQPFIEYYAMEHEAKPLLAPQITHCTGINFPMKSEEGGKADMSLTFEVFTKDSQYPGSRD